MRDNRSEKVHRQREGKPYALVAHVRFDRGRMKFNSFAHLIFQQIKKQEVKQMKAEKAKVNREFKDGMFRTQCH